MVLQNPEQVGTRVSLVRHGHVENPRRIYYGRLPGFGLSEEGRLQAVAAGRHLRSGGVTALFHSPMLRARQTAELLAEQLAEEHRLVEDELLNEIQSEFDGRPLDEMEKRGWDFYTGVTGPGEQPADIAARMARFFAFACRAHRGEHIVAVSHADPIAFAVAWACGLPLTAAGRRQLEQCGVPGGYPETASVTAFTFPDRMDPSNCAVSYWRP